MSKLGDLIMKAPVETSEGALERTVRAVREQAAPPAAEGGRRVRRRKSRPAWALAALAAVVLAVSPAGGALADGIDELVGGDGGSVPASACPEAVAALAEAGLSFDTFAPACPTEETVQQIIAAYQSSDEARGEILEEATRATPAPSLTIQDCPYLADQLERAGYGELNRIGGISSCPSRADTATIVERLP